MKVLYCDQDGGEVFYSEERNDLHEILAVLTLPDYAEFNLCLERGEEYYTGTLASTLFNKYVDDETNEMKEEVSLFFNLTAKK